jgi:hypothetical protein
VSLLVKSVFGDQAVAPHLDGFMAVVERRGWAFVDVFYTCRSDGDGQMP